MKRQKKELGQADKVREKIIENIGRGIVDMIIENLMKGETATLTEFMDSFEKTLLKMAIAKERYNQKKAAELLGIKPTTLYMKLRRFNLIKHNTIYPS